MSQEDTKNSTTHSNEGDRNFKVKAGIFLVGVTGVSALVGFGATLASVRKQDTKHFSKGMAGGLEMSEPAVSLALRALGWGTFYAFTGCGILCYSIWKLSGAESLHDFRNKMGAILPRIPKNNPPQGRTEFTGMNDLLEYLANSKSNDGGK
ncbi:hypothetical protein PPYR_01664 [Photinus pyralis]|uniref:Transmembrane protein 242 n=1 Tax=Photinus pyralis TaxID=7054 RepID=A0A1Y1K1X7_PHOPY|nr:hypothetical protein PPYR_01664 [Photinus pyralis]